MKSRLVVVILALALGATPAMAASSGLTAARRAVTASVPPVHVKPAAPGAAHKITVSFKVRRRAPHGWFWWFSVLSLTNRKGCATFAYKILKTRGTVGRTLHTTFTPRMDILDHSPTKWCTGTMVAEAQIDSYADHAFKHSKLVAESAFKVK